MPTRGFIDGNGYPTWATDEDDDGGFTYKTLATFDDVNDLLGQGTKSQITGHKAGTVSPGVLTIWQNAWAGPITAVTFATASVRVAPTAAISIKVKIDSFNQTQHTVHTITIPAGQLFAMPPGITDGPWALAYGDRVTISVESGNGEDLVVSLLVSGFGGTNQP